RYESIVCPDVLGSHDYLVSSGLAGSAARMKIEAPRWLRGKGNQFYWVLLLYKQHERWPRSWGVLRNAINLTAVVCLEDSITLRIWYPVGRWHNTFALAIAW